MCQLNDAQGEFPFWLMEILTEQDIIGVCHSKFQSVSLSIVHRPVVMLQDIESSVTPYLVNQGPCFCQDLFLGYKGKWDSV